MRTTTLTYTLRTLLVAAALPALHACTSTDFATEAPDEGRNTPGKAMTITARLTGEDAAGTRLSHTYNANGNTITQGWEVNDSIKMYRGGQGTKFYIEDSDNIRNNTSATFTGTKPTEESGNYNILYPCIKADKHQDDAILSVLGQVQKKNNGDMAHLHGYSYLVAADVAEANLNDIQFTPAVAVLRIEVPAYIPVEDEEGHALKSLTLSLEKSTDDGKDEEDIVVVQKAFGNNPVLHSSKYLTMTFEGYGKGEAVIAYMAVLPSTLTAGGKLYLSATYTGGTDTNKTTKHYSTTVATEGIGGVITFDKALVYKLKSSKWIAGNNAVIKYTGTVTGNDLTTVFNGAGTEAAPYLISTAGDLQKLINDVNGGRSYSGEYFKLTKDIHISATNWTPIGAFVNYEHIPFSGTFDGCGHTISGKMNWESGYYFGFFGSVINGTIKNLHVSADVTVEEASIQIIVTGGLVGYIAGTRNSVTFSNIINCTMSGNITTENLSGKVSTGGITGNKDYFCHITSCCNYGAISAKGTSCAIGGITANIGNPNNDNDNPSVISHCTNYGKLYAESSTGFVNLGGIVGSANDNIKNCRNEGALSATCSSNTDSEIGGIVGVFTMSGSIHTSHNASTSIRVTNDVAIPKGLILGKKGSGKMYPCCTSVPINGINLIGNGSITTPDTAH